jgi:oleate hydratase
MKAHIVGGGFGGLAAAAYLIRNAGVSGEDITIYEANGQMGGAFSLGGSATSGYILPSGSLFDADFRCTFDLLETIPSASNPAISAKKEFFEFNESHPFHDRAHIIDRNGNIIAHAPHFGLSLRDGLALVRLQLTPEAMLDGRRIEEFFSPQFFSTEFWLLFSTIMGSLPQHSAMEFRRYMNRTLAVFPDLYDMAHILRTPLNQYEAFIKPMVAWLSPRGVNFLTSTFVRDIGLAPSPDRITVNRLDYECNGAATSVVVGPDDIVLVTLGSQADGLSIGTMATPPPPPGSAPGSGGLVTLKDSGWLVSLSIFHQPEVIGQPPGTYLWWGYGLYPERKGDFVPKRMDECTGAEILEEVVRQLRFDPLLGAIMASSKCIPCNLPYANNIWMPRRRADRPRAVPEGATNLGLIGQYAEVPQDIAFTIEYSARTAWEAIHLLLKRGPVPPPVYQGQYDLKALLAALKVLLG